MKETNTPGTPGAPDGSATAYASTAKPKSKVPVVLLVLGGCGCFGIAGVAVLAAILFPVFAQAREKARAASCMSNIKQMSLGVMQYTQDWDEKYPPGKTWMASINKYVGGEYPYHCPTAAGASGAASQASQHTAPYGYAYNSKMSGAESNTEDKSNYAHQLETTPLIYDSSNLEENATDEVSSLPNPGRHYSAGHGNNVGMADGHVTMQLQGGTP